MHQVVFISFELPCRVSISDSARSPALSKDVILVLLLLPLGLFRRSRRSLSVWTSCGCLGRFGGDTLLYFGGPIHLSHHGPGMASKHGISSGGCHHAGHDEHGEIVVGLFVASTAAAAWLLLLWLCIRLADIWRRHGWLYLD